MFITRGQCVYNMEMIFGVFITSKFSSAFLSVFHILSRMEIPYFTENEWMPVVKNHVKGYLMCSGEALLWGKKNLQLQIDNPDIGWRIHPYEAPFVGYHGAVHLVNLWINEYVLTH